MSLLSIYLISIYRIINITNSVFKSQIQFSNHEYSFQITNTVFKSQIKYKSLLFSDHICQNCLWQIPWTGYLTVGILCCRMPMQVLDSIDWWWCWAYKGLFKAGVNRFKLLPVLSQLEHTAYKAINCQHCQNLGIHATQKAYGKVTGSFFYIQM